MARRIKGGNEKEGQPDKSTLRHKLKTPSQGLSDHLKGGSPPTTRSSGPPHLGCLCSELGAGLHQAPSTGLGTIALR